MSVYVRELLVTRDPRGNLNFIFFKFNATMPGMLRKRKKIVADEIANGRQRTMVPMNITVGGIFEDHGIGEPLWSFNLLPTIRTAISTTAARPPRPPTVTTLRETITTFQRPC